MHHITNAKATKFLLQSVFYTYKGSTFGLSFMISSVAPTRSSTSYAYLITKIGNGNLKAKNTKIWYEEASSPKQSVPFVVAREILVTVVTRKVIDITAL